MAQNQISVKIRNREKVLFQGSVKSVSSENERGVFDVLPQHANFISIIKKKIVLHKPEKTKQEIEIETGILKVWENQISIYLDILSPLTKSPPG